MMDAGRLIGISVSAAVHLAGAAVLLATDTLGDLTPSDKPALLLSVEMIQPSPPAKPHVAPASEPLAEIESDFSSRPRPTPRSSEAANTTSPQIAAIDRLSPAPDPEPREAARPVEMPIMDKALTGVLDPTPTSAPAPQPEGLDDLETPRTPDGGVDAVRESYLEALANALHRHKRYPRKARRRDEQGTVMLSFVIERDGRLVDRRIATSSGFDRLDHAALATLHRLDRFQPIPEALGRERWPISVPIEFRLR